MIRKEIEDERKLKRNLNLITIIMLLCVASIAILFIKYVKSSIYSAAWQPESTLRLEDPKQTSASGSIEVYTKKRKYNIKYLASYRISAYVFNLTNYRNDHVSELSPRDVALAWGSLSNKQNAMKIKSHYNPNRPRILFCEFDKELVSMLGSNYINSHLSNNHLIPSSKETKEKISQIKIGDFITIKGYLVSVSAEDMVDWVSSLDRTDAYPLYIAEKGEGGSCEIIYVTDVSWIKD